MDLKKDAIISFLTKIYKCLFDSTDQRPMNQRTEFQRLDNAKVSLKPFTNLEH